METIELKVDGMTCGHCVSAVEKAVRSVNGVRSAQVEIGNARVTIDPAAATTTDVIDAIQDAGYEVTQR